METCGLLLGTLDGGRTSVFDIIPSRNVSWNPCDSFEIDPALILQAARHSKRSDRQLMGFYHSHPYSTAKPSSRDLRLAWPNMFYLIVGIDQNGQTESTIWHVAATGMAHTFDDLVVLSPSR